MATHYVRNELGDIHSVDEDHFVNVLHTTTRGGAARLKPEFEEVAEEIARRENPQLFGHPDMEVVRGMTAAEVKEARERRTFEKELEAELAAQYGEQSDEDTETAKRRR